MDTNKVKHQYKISKWKPIIQQCRTSGMTVKAWCKANNINEKQFFYWQRRVREELLTSIQAPEENTPTIFAQLPAQTYRKETSSDPFRPDLVINIGDYRLELANQTNSELLEAVLKVIRHV